MFKEGIFRWKEIVFGDNDLISIAAETFFETFSCCCRRYFGLIGHFLTVMKVSARFICFEAAFVSRRKGHSFLDGVQGYKVLTTLHENKCLVSQR